MCPCLFSNRTLLELKSLLPFFSLKIRASKLGVQLIYGFSSYMDFHSKQIQRKIASPCYNNERPQLAMLAAIDDIHAEMIISFCSSLDLLHYCIWLCSSKLVIPLNLELVFSFCHLKFLRFKEGNSF